MTQSKNAVAPAVPVTAGNTPEPQQNPRVLAWINAYQKEVYKECPSCKWPHSPNVMCGMGATFGCVRLGGNTYYIDASNVEFMLGFVEKLGPGFHWKDEIFFDVKNDAVTVTHLESYNNTPQLKRWTIPVNEWQSIVEFVQSRVAAPSKEAAPLTVMLSKDAEEFYALPECPACNGTGKVVEPAPSPATKDTPPRSHNET